LNGKSIPNNQYFFGVSVTSYFFVAIAYLIETSADDLGFYYNLTPAILVSQTCLYSLFYVIFIFSHGILLEREASLVKLIILFYLYLDDII